MEVGGVRNLVRFESVVCTIHLRSKLCQCVSPLESLMCHMSYDKLFHRDSWKDFPCSFVIRDSELSLVGQVQLGRSSHEIFNPFVLNLIKWLTCKLLIYLSF